MIQPLDAVSAALRPDPALVNIRGLVVDAEQARSLGLQNGQVVHAVVAEGPSGLQLQWPSGARQGLPSAWHAFPLPSAWRWEAGSRLELLALLMPSGNILLRPATRAGAAAPSAAAAPAAGAATASSLPSKAEVLASGGAPAQTAAPLPSLPRFTLGQAFAAAYELAGQPAAGGAQGAADVARLLQQAPVWAGLLSLLQDLAEEPAEAAETEGLPEGTALPPSRLAELLGGVQPRMAQITAATLREALLRSGLGTEVALLAGAPGLDHDLKVALRRLQRSATVVGSATERVVARAVDDLERSQLDSLSAQMQGQILLSMAIPFGDAGPVALRLFRERVKPDEQPPPFVVDIHSRHSGLGPLWLRTVVGQDNRLALTMWAQWPEVAERARQGAQDLRLQLTQSGLTLAALEIFSGARPTEDDPFAGPPVGAGA